ncbi:hypothetical protein I6H08_38210 (plasmid) [Burkholderia gladioli]|uniref:enoyl-CoA-hydratase DpgB n=1 Tax=Burkholderia gladioli TaxID=28095 RepID=UPI001935F001|nr:enoyl-CoA-hydratase DpgB [Burkholderia gladioli]QPQ89130.1 hypothetical protein I6H08_38210 [Burkholderia gladioli]
MLERIICDFDAISVVTVDGSNFPSLAIISALNDALDKSEDSGSDRILVFHVVGNNTDSSSDPPGEFDVALVSKWERTLRRIERASTTTIVFAEGRCCIVGLELIMTADYRIVSSDLLIQLTFPGTALWPGMVLYRIVQQLGYSAARRLSLSTSVSSRRCIELGVADLVASNDPADVNGINTLLKGVPRRSDLAFARRLMQEGITATYEQALGAHLAACDRLLKMYEKSEVI